jgi:hypothetical protein
MPTLCVSFKFVAKTASTVPATLRNFPLQKKYLRSWPFATFLIQVSVIYTYCGCVTYAITVTNGRVSIYTLCDFPSHCLPVSRIPLLRLLLSRSGVELTPSTCMSSTEHEHMHSDACCCFRTRYFIKNLGGFLFFPPVSPVLHRGAILSPSTLVSFIRMATYFMPL